MMAHSFDRFDWIVLSVLLALAAATGLVLLRGDQVGVRVQDLFPASGSVGVSTRTQVRLAFDQPMDENSVERRFQIAPQTEGELTWRGKTLIWRPRGSLAAGTRYTATLAAGAHSTQGRRLKQTLTWTFYTGRPRVLFMSVGQVSQLYEVEPASQSSRQLTHFGDGSSVWDYAVSPDGSQIALSLVRPDSSAVDLWLIEADGDDARLLLACENSQCSAAAWSPDGRRLAYERRELNVELGAVGMGPGPSRVWLLELSSGHTRPLFQDRQMLGYAARWSPDGSRLGYFDPQGGVRVVNLDQDSSQLIPNQLGEMGVWSPDGRALALVDLSFAGERHFSYLLRADLAEGTIQNLSGAEIEASDSSPAWSPSGEWIAFGRKALGGGAPTPGQQLWLMRPDGSDARPLVSDPEAHLGSLAWSPDGRALAYLRFQLMQANARPEIWFLTLDGGAPVKLADNGTLPQWLP